MDLRQLRYFIAIVEHGSFSKAALSLNVAQPALSLHVRNMEADLGTALLFRSPQGVVATEAGEILLRNARIISNQFSIAQEEIRGHEAEPAGEVKLGLPGTISQILSVPLIVAARERYPKIRLRIAEAMSGFIAEWVRECRVDIAVLYTSVEDRGLASYPLLTEELCLIGPAVAVDGVKTPVTGTLALKQVTSLPLILPSSNHGLRQLLEREASSNKLELNAVIDVDSYGSIKELVERGMGYSILPFNAVARDVREGRLKSWEIGKPALKRQVHVVHPTVRPMTNAVSAIEALCRHTLLELAATGQWSGAKALK